MEYLVIFGIIYFIYLFVEDEKNKMSIKKSINENKKFIDDYIKHRYGNFK